MVLQLLVMSVLGLVMERPNQTTFSGSTDEFESLIDYSRLQETRYSASYEMRYLESNTTVILKLFREPASTYLEISGNGPKFGDIEKFVRVDNQDNFFGVKKGLDSSAWILEVVGHEDPARRDTRIRHVGLATIPWSLHSVPFHSLINRENVSIDMEPASKIDNSRTIIVSHQKPPNYVMSGLEGLPFVGGDKFLITVDDADSLKRIKHMRHEWVYNGTSYSKEWLIDYQSDDDFKVTITESTGERETVHVKRSAITPGEDVLLDLEYYGIQNPAIRASSSSSSNGFYVFLGLLGLFLFVVASWLSKRSKTST